MEYFRILVRELTRNFMKIANPENVIEVTRLNAYLSTVYKILLWENPVFTWILLAVLHIFLWIIVQFHFRLYGIAFLTILMGLVVDFYFERIGLQAVRNEKSEAIKDIFTILFNVFVYLKVLRKDNPPVFCGLMCTVFLILSVLSKNVPGYFLTYSTLILIFIGPLAISKLPNEYKNRIAKTVQLLNRSEGILAETELIPFIANKEQNETDPELESLLTDKTVDSVTSSLINGINSMPSYLEAEGSLDGLDEEDLVPNMKSSITYAPDNNSSDSDSEQRNMKFDSAHLNGDTSSDDEKHYAAGLRFSDIQEVSNSPAKLYTQQTLTQSLTLGLLNNLAAVGNSLKANVISTTNTDEQKRKDSDSEFEFINPEDAVQ